MCLKHFWLVYCHMMIDEMNFTLLPALSRFKTGVASISSARDGLRVNIMFLNAS